MLSTIDSSKEETHWKVTRKRTEHIDCGGMLLFNCEVQDKWEGGSCSELLSFHTWTEAQCMPAKFIQT